MRNSSSLDWLRFMHTPNDYRVSQKKSKKQSRQFFFIGRIDFSEYEMIEINRTNVEKIFVT